MEQLAMSEADRALIVIHGDNPWVRLVGYRVSIDGWPAGYVARGGSTEYLVDPGTHTVQVAVDGYRSLPLRLEAAPGSKTDLRIAWASSVDLEVSRERGHGHHRRHRVQLPDPPAPSLPAGCRRWALWVRPGQHRHRLLLFVALILIPRLLVNDYWALWILEPMSGAVSESSSPVSV